MRLRPLALAAAVVAVVTVALVTLPRHNPAMIDAILRHTLYPAPPVPVPSPPPTPIEEVRLPFPGGEAVAWAGGAPRTAAAPVALFFHGNGENLETMRRSGIFQALDALGIVWLAVDYPGYGRSTGEPSEESLAATADAALAWARGRHPGRPVAACGWSLGAAVAVALADRRPADVDRVALLSPWTRLAEVAAAHFPGLLARNAIGNRYDSLAAARRLAQPALVAHGERDEIIPFAQGRELADALPGLVRFLAVPTASHNDLLAYPEVWQALAEFLE